MRYLPVLIAVGALVYGLIWLMQARARRSPGPAASPRRQRRPLAPDDDPAFLAELDRLRREAERQQGDTARGPASGAGGESPAGPDEARGPRPDDAREPGTDADDGTRR